jgi:NAD+ kinase
VATVALVVNTERPRATRLASEATGWLAGQGHEVRVPASDAAALGMADLGTPSHALAAGLDLAVILGGDGTILRAVELVGHGGVPILGTNLGRLGYLAGVEPAELLESLERFLCGEYRLEERMLLEVGLHRSEPESEAHRVERVSWLALNEAVVERPNPGHTLHLAVDVAGRPWTTYAADGLILASPTGSTAYAFSARGPIVSPRLRALLMTPVSPHMAFDRSLVLDPTETVKVTVTDFRPALLVVDGRQVARLAQGDSVTCAAAATPARFVTFGDRDFYGILKAKFGVTDR